ncbi:hypothetical protein BDR03DRAFT_955423 [Suillus americanus]|nr:hypothetical protein BDR03DRAFT_955423 [Suillus americanus]
MTFCFSFLIWSSDLFLPRCLLLPTVVHERSTVIFVHSLFDNVLRRTFSRGVNISF